MTECVMGAIIVVLSLALIRAYRSPWPKIDKSFPFAIRFGAAFGPLAFFGLGKAQDDAEEKDPKARGMRKITIAGTLIPGTNTEVRYVGGAGHNCDVTIYGVAVGINGRRSLFCRPTQWGQDTDEAFFNCVVRLSITGPNMARLHRMALSSMRRQGGKGAINRLVDAAEPSWLKALRG